MIWGNGTAFYCLNLGKDRPCQRTTVAVKVMAKHAPKIIGGVLFYCLFKNQCRSDTDFLKIKMSQSRFRLKSVTHARLQ